MVIYSREKVARLREQYPAGTRICLNSMDGEAGMPQGLEGTVQYVDDAGQLGVKWDNGRSLSLIPGVDSFHKKEGQGHPEEKPRKKRESDLWKCLEAHRSKKMMRITSHHWTFCLKDWKCGTQRVLRSSSMPFISRRPERPQSLF